MARTVIQIAADPSYLDALCNDGQIFRLVNHVWQPMAPIPQDDQRETGSRPARIYPRAPPDQPNDLPTAKDCNTLVPNLSTTPSQGFILAQASHWITSSAVANSVSGMVRPSALGGGIPNTARSGL
jgi:hypothetical protein